MAIKGQALAEFIAEFTSRDDEVRERDNEAAKWNVFVDEGSNKHGLGAGVVIITPPRKEIMLCLEIGIPRYKQ